MEERAITTPPLDARAPRLRGGEEAEIRQMDERPSGSTRSSWGAAQSAPTASERMSARKDLPPVAHFGSRPRLPLPRQPKVPAATVSRSGELIALAGASHTEQELLVAVENATALLVGQFHQLAGSGSEVVEAFAVFWRWLTQDS